MPDASIERCLELCAELEAKLGNTRLAALSQLRAELSALAEAASALPDDPDEIPVITMDMAGYLTEWSKGAELLFGYSADEAIGQHILFLYAEEEDDPNSQIHEFFLDQGSPLIEVRRRKKSGEVFHAHLSLKHRFDENNHPVAMVATLFEIPNGLSTLDKLRLHAKIIEDSDEGILIIDATEHIVSVNSAFSRITGYSPEEAIGQTPDILRSGVHGADLRNVVFNAMRGGGAWHGEIVGRRKNGDLFPQSVTIGVARDHTGSVTHAFSVFSDISVLKNTERRIQQSIYYDNLTGLPNRSLFFQLVDQSLTAARRTNDLCAIMAIDLNRFAAVNDSLGHEAGDELLKQVAQRFRDALRAEDILARDSGDEFVVALVSVQKREHCALVAEKMLAALEPPFIIESNALHIDASIGIATFPENGNNSAMLQRHAVAALKRIQGNNESGYIFFSAEMDERAREQWQLENALRRALSEDQLRLYYQPKVSLRSGRILGAEALIRWIHPEQGMIAPGRFIPIAEETGLILELGNWVIEEACWQLRQWMNEGLNSIPVAINLSARQFDEALPDRLQAVAARHDVPCRLMNLELTESLLVRNPEETVRIMNRLVAHGFALNLDDFGTGYSSLANLKRYPITTLKIDRSFVMGVPDDDNDCAIARAIVTMGKQLRQEIVAEGVETPAQMAFLRELGCDQLQGYLFSPPVPAEDFARMVREKRRLSFD